MIKVEIEDKQNEILEKASKKLNITKEQLVKEIIAEKFENVRIMRNLSQKGTRKICH